MISPRTCDAFPFTGLETVYHVGTLEPSDRSGRASLEAFCLSVSLHPDEWRHIARCGDAPLWAMSRENALWLEADALSDAQAEAIGAWGVSEGLAVPFTHWRAWFHDDEADQWSFMRLATREEAEAEADEDMDPDADIVEPEPGLRLTEAGMAALERWADPSMAFEGLLILYADRVLSADIPDLVGVWWDEIEDPLSLSCPRGGVLPSRLEDFRCERVPPEDAIDIPGT